MFIQISRPRYYRQLLDGQDPAPNLPGPKRRRGSSRAAQGTERPSTVLIDDEICCLVALESLDAVSWAIWAKVPAGGVEKSL